MSSVLLVGRDNDKRLDGRPKADRLSGLTNGVEGFVYCGLDMTALPGREDTPKLKRDNGRLRSLASSLAGISRGPSGPEDVVLILGRLRLLLTVTLLYGVPPR